ncbi:DNA-protecting protein DprA [bacterium]|nr:DNA-protecting protein DprA [bacterium]
MIGSENSLAIMKLLSVPGLGPVKVNSILDWGKKSGKTPAEMFRHPELLKERLTAEQIDTFQTYTDTVESELSQKQIKVLGVLDSEYPTQLTTGLKGKTPPILYCRGNTKLLSMPGVGFCGSRKASSKGIETATDCAEQFSHEGYTVISGYAAGVDSATHLAALASGGSTIIVLPEGILNFQLKQEFKDIWDWNRVVVVSQFEPKIPWSVHNAMTRNSVICGLSKVMILIEAGMKGGSIAAGRTCLEMGRPLFAPVYDGMPETASGNRLLLTQGAKPLMKSKNSGRAALPRILKAIESVELNDEQEASQIPLFR